MAGIAHVICCNDAIKAVVLDDEEKAKTKLDKLAKRYFEQYKHGFESYADFRRQLFWHLHSVQYDGPYYEPIEIDTKGRP